MTLWVAMSFNASVILKLRAVTRVAAKALLLKIPGIWDPTTSVAIPAMLFLRNCRLLTSFIILLSFLHFSAVLN
jgi:hypothetical protein